MKWITHKVITRAVCSELGIQNADEIVEASILPDRHPDFVYRSGRKRVYRVRAPHHGLYVLAASEKEAKQLLEEGLAGLCGDCFSDLLTEGGYEITKQN